MSNTTPQTYMFVDADLEPPLEWRKQTPVNNFPAAFQGYRPANTKPFPFKVTKKSNAAFLIPKEPDDAAPAEKKGSLFASVRSMLSVPEPGTKPPAK
jgi:hypothetical protein